jgi:colanic acid biosynthesis glycosyl transferase WcaI
MAAEHETDLAGQRVLVVGINSAPEHTGIAPYTTQACEHLVAQGADVYVLTGVPHYPHWTTPAKYRRRVWFEEIHHGVPIRRLRHFVPANQSAITRGTYEATFGLQVAVQKLPWKPDVVLAVVPSLFGATAASFLARRHHARLVVWVQDLMGPATAQSGISGGHRITRFTGVVEHRLLRRADRVLVLNEGFRSYVTDAGVAPGKVEVVRNWSHVASSTADRAVTRARLGWQPDQVIALHTGNMGLKQGLENVVEAARLAGTDAPHVRFALLGDGSQREELELLGDGVPNLEFLPPASTEDYPDLLAAADVLLVNERASAAEMSLPSKLTSYFRAGRPVLAAVAADGSTAREVTVSGAGLLVEPEDPAALLKGVEVLADPARTCTYAQAATLHLERYLTPAAVLRQFSAAVCPP